MYKIIGTDQNEYGPYTVEQVRELIAARRADASTLAKTDEIPHWQTLSQFPEFAEDLARAAAIPPVYAAGAQTGEPLTMGEVFSRAWTLFRDNAGLLVGSNLVAIVIAIAVEFVPVIGPLIGVVLYGPVFAGVALISLKLARGEGATFDDTFIGFKTHCLQLMAAGIVVHIGFLIGFLLLILPGILLLGLWIFCFLNILDRGLPFWDALEVSRKNTQPRWGWYLWVCARYPDPRVRWVGLLRRRDPCVHASHQ